jgi:hypothetical protein
LFRIKILHGYSGAPNLKGQHALVAKILQATFNLYTS